MVSAHSHKVSRVSWYSGSCLAAFDFGYAAFTLSRRTSQTVLLASSDRDVCPQPRRINPPVWPLSISLAATLKIEFSFSSSGYLDVSVHRVPEHTLWIHVCTTKVCLARFPHSEIHGSMLICSSPWLFAAYHVFLRLSVPRHPPCALFRLTCYDTLPSVVMHHLLLACCF